ncbi:MAG: DUF6345 domain-containing protein [Caldilineaceae bacterium]
MLSKSSLFSWKGRLIRAISMGVVASVLLVPTVQAADPDQKSPYSSAPAGVTEPRQPNAVTADDGGQWELGVEGTAGNLTQATAAERYGMWYWLNGWFRLNFSYAEPLAWETDFKRGASENNYIDSVDLQFYVGHGAPAVFTFDNASHNDDRINAPADCDTSWGDNDNEWFALTSCQVLADSGIGPMAQCMNREHLILGFVTNASAHNNYWDTQAYHFGRYMRYGYSMTSAWFNACDVAQRGRTTRVIAEETSCFNDNPYYGSVCADSYDNDYYWYTHSCGTESASYVPVQTLASVPVFAVDPYSLAKAQSAFSKLGNVFSIPVSATLQAAEGPGNPPGQPSDSPFFVSTDVSKTLEMDKGSGIYKYTDMNALFSGAAVDNALTVNASAANYINSDTAKQIADNFLNQNQLMPDDSQFYEVISDTTGTLGKQVVASAADIAAAETPAVWQVIYSRKLNATVLTAAGASEAITFTVVGPGAKQKVYVPLTGQVNAAGNVGASPIGAQGGWRSVSQAVNAATGEQIMVDIQPDAVIRQLYLALDKSVTMNSIPQNISNRNVVSSTLAYWESAPGSSQGHLIPVYELTVDYTDLSNNQPGQDLFYVPATSQYMAPFAKILDAPESADPGQTITLNAADATKTLKALGVGDAFDFVMGYAGADGTYTYDWYMNSVAPENKIAGCSGKACTMTLPANNSDKDATAQVILQVTDTDSPNKSVSTATAEITVNGKALFLPLVTK